MEALDTSLLHSSRPQLLHTDTHIVVALARASSIKLPSLPWRFQFSSSFPSSSPCRKEEIKWWKKKREMSRDLELSSRVLPAGASSYYHDSDNDGGDRGGGSTTQSALFDISSSQSQGSLSNDHEHQKPPLSVEVENKANNSDKTTAGIIADSIDSSKNFLYRMSINHGDIGFRGDSLIDFKNGGTGSGSFKKGKGSLLSFEQNHQVWIHQPKSVDDSSIWKHDGDNIMSGAYVDHHLRQVTPASDPKGCSSSSHIPDLISNHSYYQQGKSSYGWLYSDSTVVAADRVQEAGLQERALFKRPYMV